MIIRPEELLDKSRYRWGYHAIGDEHWPTPQPFTLAGLLSPRHLLDLRRRHDEIEALKKLARCPIILISGMLNKGKTSIISSFLSPAGQKRALRGISGRNGTQRFVFWVPHSWKQDPELWSLFLDFIRQVFPNGYALLSEEAEAAHRQYSDVAKFDVPLIATDPKLDALGFAFLDSPDVQREHHSPSAQNVRLKMLSNGARLCSAIYVVTDYTGLMDEMLAKILTSLEETCPGVPMSMIVNLLHPNASPDAILDESSHFRTRFKIEKVFGEWDYDYPASQSRRPQAHLEAGFPTPFLLKAGKKHNPPHAIPKSRMLGEHLKNLPMAALHRTHLASRRSEMREALNAAVASVRTSIQDRSRQIMRAHEGLLKVCERLLVDRHGSTRILVDQEVIEKLVQHITWNAPLYVRPFLVLNRSIRQVFNTAADWIRQRFASEEELEEARRKAAERGYGRVLNQQAFIEALRAYDVDHELGDIDLEAACKRIQDRFLKEHKSDLTDEEYKEMADEIWKALGVLQKIQVTVVASLGVGIGLLVGYYTAWFDGGAVALSLNEIVASVLIGTTVGTRRAGNLDKQLNEKAGLPTVSSLLALMCDAFGLPRERVQVDAAGAATVGGVWVLKDHGALPLAKPEVRLDRTPVPIGNISHNADILQEYIP